MIRLDPELAGGPYDLTVVGKDTLRLRQVLVGEVWICSGQSNMEFPVSAVTNAVQEIREANFPEIRHYKVPNRVASAPQADISGGAWELCSPETVGNFTAVGYFFARELYKDLRVPVGLINTSWGGTMVETWISRGAFELDSDFHEMIAEMPSLNLDSLAAGRKKSVTDRILALQGTIGKGSSGKDWAVVALDDSHWPKMKLPGLWEQQGLGLEDLDGLVWFRKIVEIPEAEAGKPAIIEFGKIDDSDDCYLNGTRIGGMKNQYNELRRYNIPAGILRPGKNLIAVRVEDTGGGGGFWGEATDMKLTVGSLTIPLAGEWAFRVDSVYAAASGQSPNSYPTLLFNAMVNPLIPFGIRGAIWYQGEANAGRAYEYRKSFPLMISDWRSRWGQGNFPFYFVQLASFNAGNGNSAQGSEWAELREAQTMTLSLPATGMAVTTDIGLPNDVHPKNKQEVGKRLAAIALDHVYGQSQEFSGPVFRTMELRGDTAVINFSHLGKGLYAKDPYGYIRGFEVADQEHRYYYAQAFIRGDQVLVFHEGIHPVSVHYGWADDAGEANLFNRDGFPAPPFRTDQWKGRTDMLHYRIGQ
jgi:sialate O-acetylesterase